MNRLNRVALLASFLMLQHVPAVAEPSLLSDDERAFAPSSIGLASRWVFKEHSLALVSCLPVGVAVQFISPIRGDGFSEGDFITDVIGCGLGVLTSEHLGVRLGVDRKMGANFITISVDF